jgi:general secretion pathway protein D
MRRSGILSLATIVAGLGVFAAGCVHGRGGHRHDDAARVAAPPSAAKTSATDQSEAATLSLPPSVGESFAEDSAASRGDVRLTAHETEAPSSPAEVVPLPQGTVVEKKPNEARFVASPEGTAVEKKSNGAKSVAAPQGAAAGTKSNEAKSVASPEGAAVETKSNGAKSVASLSGGTPITLHVANLDVRNVLETLSRQANMNILVSPGVKGTVTLDLSDKTVDEALQAIATLCGLEVRSEKDFLVVSTAAEVRQREADKRQREENDLPVRVYRLNYVKSTDVEKMIKPLLSARGKMTTSPDSDVGLPSDAAGAARAGSSETTKDVKAGGNSMAGGEIVVVQDYEHVLKMTDRVVAELDVQPIQVLIEAVIVSVKLDKGMQLGANFAILDGAGNALGVLGNGSLINAAAGFAPAAVLAAAGGANSTTTTTTIDSSKGSSANTVIKTSTTGAMSNGLGANTNGIKFGWVGGNTTGFIKALESVGDTKVLACPRLLVLNKQRAEIHLGEQLGYKTSTQTQTSTTETVNFMPVGTQLRLRPFVSSDGMIRMEVHPERSSGNLDDFQVPQTRAAQVTTNVMVPDGATIVIGGLVDSETTRTWSGVPFLSRLPWIGYLFRDTNDTVAKRELIIILTPHIWRPECPEATNYLGKPKTQGLEVRTAQRPREECRDGPSVYELTRPEMPCPMPNGLPSAELPSAQTGAAVPGGRKGSGLR